VDSTKYYSQSLVCDSHDFGTLYSVEAAQNEHTSVVENGIERDILTTSVAGDDWLLDEDIRLEVYEMDFHSPPRRSERLSQQEPVRHEEYVGKISCEVTSPTDRRNLEELVNKETIDTKYTKIVGRIIGQLWWLAGISRPDIMYAVYRVSKFQQKPCAPVLQALIRIMRYLKSNFRCGLYFWRSKVSIPLQVSNEHKFVFPTEIDIKLWTDASHQSEEFSYKSTAGYALMVGDCLVGWSSKTTDSVCLSTTGSEYAAASIAVQELLFVRNFLSELFSELPTSRVFLDNEGAVRMASNRGGSKAARHIAARHRYVQDAVDNGEILPLLISNKFMVADMFTKGSLTTESFKSCVEEITRVRGGSMTTFTPVLSLLGIRHQSIHSLFDNA
jgi:hypothetical protein